MRNILSYPSILPDEHTCFSILQAKNGTRRRKCGWIWTKTTFRPRTTTFHKAGNRPLTPIPANLTNSTSPFVSPSHDRRPRCCHGCALPSRGGRFWGRRHPELMTQSEISSVLSCASCSPCLRVRNMWSKPLGYVRDIGDCLVLSCLLTLYTAVEEKNLHTGGLGCWHKTE